MKSLLLSKEDYEKIMKLDPNEILKFMQDGVYKDEINHYIIRYSGIRLAENALNRHLEKIILKLKAMADPDVKYLMDQYLKRYDVSNLKTLLRAKQSDMMADEVMDLLLPVGELSLDRLRKLYSEASAKDIIRKSGLVEHKDFKDAVEEYESTKNLAELENLLDYTYLKEAASFGQQIPVQGKQYKDFIKNEVDIYNIGLILKKIVFRIDKEFISRFLIFKGKDLTREHLKLMLDKDSLPAFLAEIKRTNYKSLLSDIDEDTKDLVLRMEVKFNEFLLKKSMALFHKIPLTLNVVVGYIFAKEIEVKNLRTIIKSKKLNFKESYIKNMIVI